jgi:hypothetical protein
VRTYTCDKCGAVAHEKGGIVGNEHDQQGFETLSPAYRWGDVVDVCRACFKELKTAAARADKEATATKRRRFLAWLGIREHNDE